MHLRCCCVSDEAVDKNKTENKISSSTANSVPIVVAQQPKPTQAIELDKITEVSNEESSVQAAREIPKTPPSVRSPPQIAQNPIYKCNEKAVQHDKITDSTKIDIEQKREEKVATKLEELMDTWAHLDEGSVLHQKTLEEMMQTLRSLNSEKPVVVETTWSNNGNVGSSITMKIGQEPLKFENIGRGYFMGTYKGAHFVLFNGQFYASNCTYTQQDKDAILKAFSSVPIRKEEAVSRPEPLNVNFTGRNGDKCNLVFHPVSPGHFSGTFKGKEFSIINGKFQTSDDQFDYLDEQLIVTNFEMALSGLEMGILGMQKGMHSMRNEGSGMEANRLEMEAGINRMESLLAFANTRVGCDINAKASTRGESSKPGLRQPLMIEDITYKPDELPKSSGTAQLKVFAPIDYEQFGNEVLKAHNDYRRNHGVPPLIHSHYLSEMAREWAEHLAEKNALYHRSSGENLVLFENKTLCPRATVKFWYDQIELYDFNNPKFSTETGSFTQLVWKDTKEVGTGFAQKGNKIWVCCNYYPQGNVSNKFNEEYVPRALTKRYM